MVLKVILIQKNNFGTRQFMKEYLNLFIDQEYPDFIDKYL